LWGRALPIKGAWELERVPLRRGRGRGSKRSCAKGDVPFGLQRIRGGWSAIGRWE